MVERGELEMEELDIDINELMPSMDETEYGYVINNQTETMKKRRKKMEL